MILLSRNGAGAAVLCLLAACATKPPPPPPAAPAVVVEVTPVSGWRAVASAEDESRIDRVNRAWEAALAQVKDERYVTALKEEGELLEPSAALQLPTPPPGPYRCRVIKLGTQGDGPAFNAYKSFFCYVEAEGDLLTIVKQTGSQRPAGRIYPDADDEGRLIFLGTMSLGDEKDPIPYGEDKERDMAGVVERVAPFRYRLVIPYPRNESLLDVFELVPVTPEPPAQTPTP